MVTLTHVDKSLGDVIDGLLATQGRKVSWFHGAVGMSWGTLRAIRLGRRSLKRDEALRMAAAFGVEPEQFLVYVEPEEVSA